MAKQPPSLGDVRIIGGYWRGRKIPVLDQAGLRPTPNRVRETLFNWLQPDIVDARCVDLFAGSGALGIEALSRGAASVDFVDNTRAVIQQLQQNCQQLQAKNAYMHHTDALVFLRQFDKPVDIVFLDPPFQSDCLLQCCTLLEQASWLSSDNRIYIETAQPAHLQALSARWQCLREKKAGHVFYYLFHCACSSSLS